MRLRIEMVREQIRISALFQISRMDMPPLVLWLFLSSAYTTIYYYYAGSLS